MRGAINEMAPQELMRGAITHLAQSPRLPCLRRALDACLERLRSILPLLNLGGVDGLFTSLDKQGRR
jgi:hypothetical protein